MKVGIIGDGGHSKRIQKILREKKLSYFIYKPNKPKYFDKEKFEQLKKCRVIFIISPNKTHFFYIKKLYRNRYIFCEKPPVNNKKELLELKKIKSRKIYFNYNYRFNKITEFIKNKDKYKLGKLVYANISMSQGLAQKKIYQNNWRSNINSCPRGIYELVSIHYIDMINYLFNISNIEKPKLINLSKKGNSYDTSLIEIKLKNEGFVNIFSSYNTSFNQYSCFLFENGILEQHNNIITLKGPTLNLDQRGFFKTPKVIKSVKISEGSYYSNSLFESVTFFLNHVKNKKIFNKKDKEIALESNLAIL